ncbi:MAG: histidine phosphatase family protein [Acidimicrobiales bacterium]
MASAGTRIVLVRHGESMATVNQVVGGHQGCTGLSPVGRAQVGALADRLARTGELGPVTALVTSVLPRAIETAEILAPALGGLAVVRDCDVCEIHPGEGDALPWSEFDARYGDGWSGRPFNAAAPGAESGADFAVRVGRTLRRLADQHEGGTVVVACHGGVVEGSFVAFGNQPLVPAFGFHVHNASITEWTHHDGRWWLARFNDAAHLPAVSRK